MELVCPTYSTLRTLLTSRYCEFVAACFCHNRVTVWMEDLLDHRYFYRYRYNRSWYGSYTCGLVRDVVVDQLLLHQEVDFADADFLDNQSTSVCKRKA